MTCKKKKAAAEAVAAAWQSSEGAELRQMLFPNGQPTPDEFVRVVAAYVKEQHDKQCQRR